MQAEDCFNSHRKTLREMVAVLVCHENDVRSINAKMCKIQKELKQQVEEIVTHIESLRKKATLCKESSTDFTKYIGALNDIVNCTKTRIEDLKKTRENLYANAALCIREFHAEKIRTKHSYDTTREHLKYKMIHAKDKNEILSYRYRIINLEKTITVDMRNINCELKIMNTFFQELRSRGIDIVCEDDPLAEFGWPPTGEKSAWLKSMTENIKKTMGKGVVKAFTEMHLHPPKDPMEFLALYFLNTSAERQSKLYGSESCT